MRLRSFAPAAIIALAVTGCAAFGGRQQSTPESRPSAEQLAHADDLLRETMLVDGHNDLPWEIRTDSAKPFDVVAYDLRGRTQGHTDIARLRQGRVGGQFWSVYIPGDTATQRLGFAKVQLEQIDIARRMIAMYPEALEPARTAAELRMAFARARIGSVLGMEGGHAIENSLGALRAFNALGAKYMTLTHNQNIDWADANAGTPRLGGLSPFGREVVREMNRLGMLVDLSHTSDGTMSDALDVTAAPVIFSHSNARALANHNRNVPDSILARMPRNGGVVMVTFVPGFTSQRVIDFNRLPAEQRRGTAPRATLSQIADHIEHIRKVAGIDHVGIGGDFDGIDELVEGLEDVTSYPRLFAELLRRGWSDADLRKLASENILRVLEQSEQVAARLQRERPASTATIEALDRGSR
ncbi:MAG TPA: dipeptidase [Gemmatimonadaceae bacterium]|jgi:membrane dipeptidase|nr:dipeptidase [Gemmatimonadaceae bacterium]